MNESTGRTGKMELQPVMGKVKLFLTVAGVALLPACSTVNAVTDTVSDTVGSLFGSTRPEVSAPGANQPFPNLSSVPERPAVPSPEERAAVQKGLIADRENAQYTGEAVRRQPGAGGVPPQPAALPQETVATPRQGTSAAQPPAPVIAPPPAPAPIQPPRPGTIAAPAPPPPPAAAVPPPPPAPALAPQSSVAPAARPQVPVPEAATADTLTRAYRDHLAQSAVATGGVTVPARETVAVPVAQAPVVSPPPSQTVPMSPTPVPLELASVTVQAARIPFAPGSTRLGSNDLKALRDVIDLYRNTGGTIRVVGLGLNERKGKNAVERRVRDLDVATARAQAVAQALIGMGVRPEAIRTDAIADPTAARAGGGRAAEVYLDY